MSPSLIDNLFYGRITPELKESFGFEPSNYPPWFLFWIPLLLDSLCLPFSSTCPATWRSYLPTSLTGPGGWFSEEYLITDVYLEYPHRLSFQEFQAREDIQPSTLKEWMSSIYTFAFETDSTTLSDLFSIDAILVVAVLVVCLQNFKRFAMPLFQQVGVHLAKKTHGQHWMQQKENQERIVKFGEYVYRLFYHSFISYVAYKFFWDAPWWNQDQGGTKTLYIGFPNAPVTPRMTWYYLLQAAYNVDAMYSLLKISLEIKLNPHPHITWSDTVRGDFNEMLFHHIVTNALVYLSNFFQQTKIGSMVFWMHDLSDVPVDLSKLANFIKSTPATAVCFTLLFVTWFVTRMYVLPFYIWKSVFDESVYLVQAKEKYKVYYYFMQPIFITLLGCLIALHCYWFSLMLQIAKGLIIDKEAHDLSEHKTGEKYYENGKKSNGNSKPVKKEKSGGNNHASAALAVLGATAIAYYFRQSL